ncbi:hypothetical protein O7605_07505 [Verrucosispora sp. WMMA2121]|nr:hypothetical protein [Verrucosispora sp. WMMA2121]MCZ7419366.1 hypothetical protein [Verrucosispora sp. WMMA2121]
MRQPERSPWGRSVRQPPGIREPGRPADTAVVAYGLDMRYSRIGG